MANTSQDAHLLDIDAEHHHHLGHKRNHSGVDVIKLHNRRNSYSSSSSNGKGKPGAKEFVMFYRRRMLKLAVLALISMAFAGVYFEFFKHPPADVLLVMNRQASSGDQGMYHDFGASSFVKSSNEDKDKDSSDECEDEDECQVKGKRSVKMRDPSEVEGAEYWLGFLKSNNLVPIGAIFDRCDDWRSQYGTVVLMKDTVNGGIMARTYVNITLDEEISSGQFNIEVKYNGQELYDNYWDVCEIEDELPKENRTFVCPVQAGKHSRVKDKHIPIYLPTGHYQTKAWVTDESEEMLACAYADFKL